MDLKGFAIRSLLPFINQGCHDDYDHKGEIFPLLITQDVRTREWTINNSVKSSFLSYFSGFSHQQKRFDGWVLTQKKQKMA